MGEQDVAMRARPIAWEEGAEQSLGVHGGGGHEGGAAGAVGEQEGG